MKVISGIGKLRKQAGREVTVILAGRVNVTPNGVFLAVGPEEASFFPLDQRDFDNGMLVLRGDK